MTRNKLWAALIAAVSAVNRRAGYRLLLWRLPTTTCRHCGDGTDPDDDPAPDLCLMCATAGRTTAKRWSGA